MTNRTRNRLIAATGFVVVGVPLFIAGSLWYGPSGWGEHRESPDGRFRAEASNMSTGTITGERVKYLRLAVVDNATRQEIWSVIHHHPQGAGVTDYSVRGPVIVVWAPDSKSVRFPIYLESERDIVLQIP